MLTAATVETELLGHPGDSRAAKEESVDSKWYVLWSHSHCEQLVYDQLAGKGFQPYLPKIEVWSRRGGLRNVIQVPLFPGYLFLYHSMDKTSYIEVRKSRGLVCVLGKAWDRLAVVPEAEIDAVRKVLGAGLPAFPHPYLREGQRVRVTGGPLAGVEGILMQMKPRKGLLVLSVNLLQRSVATEVDCTQVVPVAASRVE